jgi:aminoglycoside 6'-N-acetyltransferase I
MAEIRRLDLADKQAWAEQRLALWPEGSLAEFSAEIDQMLADADRQPGFGIFIGARMGGFAEASEREWGNGCLTAPVAWLEGIYIDPAYRRAGLASQLVKAVIAWARARNLTELGSDVSVDNAVSLFSHRQWGFVETERLVVLRKDIA